MTSHCQFKTLRLYNCQYLMFRLYRWSFFNRYNLYTFMPPKELWEAYSNCTVRPSVPLRVRCISPRFFEVGIPNLVCGYILGWRSVAYHFRVTVTLTSDLVFRIIVSRAYLLYYLRQESQIWCVDASWDDEVSHTIIGSL